MSPISCFLILVLVVVKLTRVHYTEKTSIHKVYWNDVEEKQNHHVSTVCFRIVIGDLVPPEYIITASRLDVGRNQAEAEADLGVEFVVNVDLELVAWVGRV